VRRLRLKDPKAKAYQNSLPRLLPGRNFLDEVSVVVPFEFLRQGHRAAMTAPCSAAQ